jgi:hypothetical protein
MSEDKDWEDEEWDDEDWEDDDESDDEDEEEEALATIYLPISIPSLSIAKYQLK